MAETNPDSIKSLWLEREDKPDQIEVDWDNFEVRIIVIAPSIDVATLEFVQRIDYPVDLLEIKRWVEGDNQLIMVNKIEQQQRRAKISRVRGLRVYDLSTRQSATMRVSSSS